MADELKQKMKSEGVLSSIVVDGHYYHCCFCYNQFDETKKPNLLKNGELCCISCYFKSKKFPMKQQDYNIVLQLIKIEKEKVQKMKTFNFYIQGFGKGKSRSLNNIPSSATIKQMLKKSQLFQEYYRINKEKTGIFINKKNFSYEKQKDTTIAYLVKHKSIAEGLQEDDVINLRFHNRFDGGECDS